MKIQCDHKMAMTVAMIAILAIATQAHRPDNNANLDSLYPTYKLIEDTIKNDPKLLFKIKKVFFPAMNFRYWQVDGAEVIPIHVTLALQDDTEQEYLTQCNVSGKIGEKLVEKSTEIWWFQWTNSLLLNLIPSDILLAMDPLLSTTTYSGIVTSLYNRRLKLHLSLNITGSSDICHKSVNEVEQSVALLLSSVKSVVLSTPDSQSQGYIARWHIYYNYDSYFNKLNPDTHYTTIFKGLWATFAILNVLIPVLFVTRGKKVFTRMTEVTVTSNKRLCRATMLVIIVFNSLYIVGTITAHVKGYPQLLNCFLSTTTHPCFVSPSSTSYYYIIGILITKLVILPVALAIELAVAVYTTSALMKINCKKASTNKRLTFVMQTFATYHLLIFVQITLGLISIPMIVYTFISPVHTLLQNGCFLLITLMITYVLATFPLPSIRKLRCAHCLLGVESLVVATFVAITSCTYFLVMTYGMNMDGFRGYVMTLAPSIPISIFLWIIKKKYLAETVENKMRKRRKLKMAMVLKKRDSFSTEEELIYSTTSESSKPLLDVNIA